jgi:hypothetical protein
MGSASVDGLVGFVVSCTDDRTQGQETFMHEVAVDGKGTLQQQQDTLQLQENLGFALVLKYLKDKTGAIRNIATLDDVSGTQLPIRLFAITSSTSSASVIAANPGASIVFQNLIFVEGKDADVLGIR